MEPVYYITYCTWHAFNDIPAAGKKQIIMRIIEMCVVAITLVEDGKQRLLPFVRWDRYTAIHVPVCR